MAWALVVIGFAFLAGVLKSADDAGFRQARTGRILASNPEPLEGQWFLAADWQSNIRYIFRKSSENAGFTLYRNIRFAIFGRFDLCVG